MGAAQLIAELWRGPVLESLHLGHAVVADMSGPREVWGDPDTVILPRSSCKMVQALPLLTSGAATAAGLEDTHLALACASHNGAAIHTDLARQWLSGLGMAEDHYRCGPQEPADLGARNALICAGRAPGQIHNNCSGKHAGFLTLGRHLNAGPEYIEIDHPVQIAVRDAFCELTGADGTQWAVDGCSAPNFACTVAGLAQAMAWFATAGHRDDITSTAAHRLTNAMMAHPQLVAGEGRACTNIMRAAKGAVAVKTGAEGVFVAILPKYGLGVAVKAADGATRAAECAIAALLAHVGVFDRDDPVIMQYTQAKVLSRAGLDAGVLRVASGFA